MKIGALSYSVKTSCWHWTETNSKGERRCFRFKTERQAKAARKRHLRERRELGKLIERLKEIRKRMNKKQKEAKK